MQRVIAVFVALDREVPFRHAANERTRCRVYEDNGESICEVVFGPDIFPGRSVIDPNSALSMRAAVAHELSHFHRWQDETELDGEALAHIDEALTSLDAVQRYSRHLTETEVRQLVAGAMQRLQIFAQNVDRELLSTVLEDDDRSVTDSSGSAISEGYGGNPAETRD